MKPFSKTNKLGRFLLMLVSGYNHKKYWKRREYVVNPSKKNILLKLYYLFYLKRKDSRFLCSFGTNVNIGNNYKTPPYLPHGPYGIIVGHDAKIGEGVIIYHQVTIAGGNVEIGDHTELGAGAKILPNVKIGRNVHVGANCIVVDDIPDYATVVLQKPRIIIKDEK